MTGFHTWLREPLLHFAILGGVLYLLMGSVEQPQAVVIGEREVAYVKQVYKLQYGAEPSDTRLQELVEHHIREELFWREGLALGLDEDDPIVRRRIAQKFEFKQKSQIELPEPDDTTLQQFLQQHREHYQPELQLSLEQIYLPAWIDQSELQTIKTCLDQNNKRCARAVADNANKDHPMPVETVTPLQPVSYYQRSLGDSELVQALPSLPPGQWHGPLQSGLGWHFVNLLERNAATPVALTDVRERVRTDYMQQQREQILQAEYVALREKYQVRIESAEVAGPAQ